MWETVTEIDAAAGDFSQQLSAVGPLQIEDHLTQLGLTAPPSYNARTNVAKILNIRYGVAVLIHSKDLEILSAVRTVAQSDIRWLLKQWTCSQIFPNAHQTSSRTTMFLDEQVPYEDVPFDHAHFTVDQSRAVNRKMLALTEAFLQALSASPMTVATQTATALAHLVDFTVGCQNAHQQAADKAKSQGLESVKHQPYQNCYKIPCHIQ